MREIFVFAGGGIIFSTEYCVILQCGNGNALSLSGALFGDELGKRST